MTALYRDLLAELAPGVQMPFAGTRGTSCFHILPILLPEGLDRIRFMEDMKARGVQTSIHCPPVHLFQSYRNGAASANGALPITEAASSREVTLPLYPGMKDADVAWVVESVRQALNAT